jgi:hypothetical protein
VGFLSALPTQIGHFIVAAWAYLADRLICYAGQRISGDPTAALFGTDVARTEREAEHVAWRHPLVVAFAQVAPAEIARQVARRDAFEADHPTLQARDEAVDVLDVEAFVGAFANMVSAFRADAFDVTASNASRFTGVSVSNCSTRAC